MNVFIRGRRWINVYIVSSIHDQNAASTGLCGQLTGHCRDDFVFRNGSLSPENDECDVRIRNYPNSFNREWRYVYLFS